jgi:hypothetical protein
VSPSSPITEVFMSIDRAVLALAGNVVLLSLALSAFIHPYWLALAAFAGLNMIQAAFTGFCPVRVETGSGIPVRWRAGVLK